MAVQIAKFQVGTADMCQIITVEQTATDLFTVHNWQQTDGEQSEKRFARFVNARLAFDHAMKIAADEIDDVCETVDG